MIARSLPGLSAESWLLLDPAVPQISEKAGILLRHLDSFTHIKQCLLTTGNLTTIALEGPSGSGKTALAVAVATDRQVLAHFCNGILWATLGLYPNVLDQLSRWGELLGVTLNEEEATSLQAWKQALQAAVGNRHFLVVIDDAWNREDAQYLQIGGITHWRELKPF